MRLDSFRFLPRSFRPLYENPTRLPGEDETVWAPAEKRLAAMRVTLLTSAGLYVRGEQPPFDLARAYLEVAGRGEVAPLDGSPLRTRLEPGQQVDAELAPPSHAGMRFVVVEGTGGLGPGTFEIGGEGSPLHSVAGWPL
jgi:hypothetical protein